MLCLNQFDGKDLILNYVFDVMWLTQITVSFITIPESLPLPHTCKTVANSYLRGMFFFDMICFVPSIILNRLGMYREAYFCYCFRVLNVRKIQYPLARFNDLCITAPKRRKRNINFLTKLLLAGMMFCHYCACVWIALGLQDQGKADPQSWLLKPSNGFPQPAEENTYTVYTFAIYWVTTTITTVGYGDYTGSTSPELLFSIILEFSGMCFFALLSAVVIGFFKQDHSFSNQVSAKLQMLDFWIKRLEYPAPNNLSPKLLLEISTSVDAAFRFDFNMLVEDNLTLYQKLTPRMQTELVDLIFTDFLNTFSDFFNNVEVGFRNEFVINLHTRLLNHGEVVLSQLQQVPEIYLVMSGSVEVKIPNIPGGVLHYQEGSIFGDYNVLFNTPAQMFYMADSTGSDRLLAGEPQTVFMCCEAKLFRSLCD